MTDDEVPAVYCPFAADMRCPTDPPCPTLRARVCINGEDDTEPEEQP
jgi:hypothetical protein